MCRYAYSLEPNPWDWLTSQAKAEAMAKRVRLGRSVVTEVTVMTVLEDVTFITVVVTAVQVASWKDQYGIDGVDLDIEEGAGSREVQETSQFYLNLNSYSPLFHLRGHFGCISGLANNFGYHNRELTENIPNWAYYPQLEISNPQWGIIYPVGDWGYMSPVTPSQRTNHQSPISSVVLFNPSLREAIFIFFF